MGFFSVVIPVYNVEAYLSKCVDSVLSQTCSEYEVILVDDGSEDHSGEICDGYAEENARVRVIHQNNRGLAAARNAGAAAARNEYIIFLDSDDWWNDDHLLEKVKAILQKSQSDMLVFGCKRFSENRDKYISESIFSCVKDHVATFNVEELVPKLIDNSEFLSSAWSYAIRRELFVRFCEDLRNQEDIEWISRQYYNIKTVDVLNETPYTYRARNGSLSKTVRHDQWIISADVIRRVLANLEAEQWSDKMKQAWMDSMAYQYYLLISTIGLMNNRTERRQALNGICDLAFLGNGRGGRKGRYAQMAMSIFGQSGCIYLLSRYRKLRNLIVKV